MEPPLRRSLARDRFIAGVRPGYIQERLLQEASKTLDEARSTAKRLEAARAARKKMQSDKTILHAVDSSTSSGNTSNAVKPAQGVAAVERPDGLAEAVRQNTETLQQLMQQLATMQLKSIPRQFQGKARPVKQRPQNCWKCEELGHYMRNCPSGNEQRPVPRVNRRSPNN